MRHPDLFAWLAPVRTSQAALVTVLGFSLLHCTTTGLSALGAGSSGSSVIFDGSAPAADSEAGTTDSASAPKAFDTGASALADAALDGPDSTLDDGHVAESDGAAQAVGDATDAGVDAADDGGVDAAPSQPATAPPEWLDAGTQGWCDAHPGYAFCADFDRTPLPAGFTSSEGAYIAETSTLASSGPNDLLLYVPPLTSMGQFGSKLSRSFSTPASTVVLALDFRPDGLNSTSSGLLFAALDFQNNQNAKYSVRLAYNQGAARLEETVFAGQDIYHPNLAVPLRTWSRIQVELTFVDPADGGSGSPMEAIYVDGVLQGVPEMLSPPVGFSPIPTLLIGAVYGTGPTDGWVLRYDNVTLDIH